MAREHGDLSADVEDPEKDWADKGVTYQAFQAMKPAFVGGLSSRCIVGESGPMHLVRTHRPECKHMHTKYAIRRSYLGDGTCLPVLDMT